MVSHADVRKSECESFSEVLRYFPAVTGIMAGVSMSDDLRNARASLPKGTLLAIGTGFVVYMTLPFLLILNLNRSN